MVRSNRWKKDCLSTSMFDGWPCSYWPSYLYCQRNPCDGYNPPQLLASSHSRVRRNNCLLWVDPQYVRRRTPLLSFQTTGDKSPLTNISTFQSQCLGHVAWPTTKFFSGPSRHTGKGRKRSCPYSLCPNPSTPFVRLVTVLCIAVRCQMLFRPFTVFTKVKIHVICISCRVAYFQHFDAETFAFFGMYCLNDTIPLNFTMISSIAKCSERL